MRRRRPGVEDAADVASVGEGPSRAGDEAAVPVGAVEAPGRKVDRGREGGGSEMA